MPPAPAMFFTTTLGVPGRYWLIERDSSRA